MKKNLLINQPNFKLFLHKINVSHLSIITLLIIFSLAVIPRILDLGTGLTYDEQDWIPYSNYFFNAFIHFDFAHTIYYNPPGVTTAWISGIFLKLFSNHSMTFPQILTIARLPVALVTSLGILVMYFLLKELLNGRIALLGAILIALDPFYIAHSRLIHADALLTTFMILSFLSLLVFLSRREKVNFLFFSGVFLGLSLLTKLPALSSIPIFILTLIIWQLASTYSTNHNLKKTCIDCVSLKNIGRIITPLLVIFLISGALFVLLWPAMWVNPFYVSNFLFNRLSWAIEQPHPIGFFMGVAENSSFYGPLFYPIIILLKTTPLTLLFSLLCIFYLFYNIRKPECAKVNLVLISFIIFIFLFVSAMTIGEKKFDRYLLPIFPFIDCIAAVGIYSCYRTIMEWRDKSHYKIAKKVSKIPRNSIFQILLLLVVLSQVLLLWPIAPYYLSYSNPIAFGGPKNVSNVTVIGWGEGNDLAAAYLNDKPNAENITVVADFRGFSQYFKGKTITLRIGKQVTMKDISSSDYIVFYVNAVQMHLFNEIWNNYKDKTPEKIITLNNIDYCRIYPTNTSITEGKAID